MCIFSLEVPTEQKGLLTLEQFKLPLPDEELGGDVIIGWRSWTLRNIRLGSPHYSQMWPVDRPVEVQRTVSQRHPVAGIHAYELPEVAYRERWLVFGRVALFGRVLSFEQGDQSRRGSMGQYGYPLDLYTTKEQVVFLRDYADQNVNIWSVGKGWPNGNGGERDGGFEKMIATAQKV